MQSRTIVALAIAVAVTHAIPALADATNAPPVINVTQTPFDPATMPWVTDADRTSITGMETQLVQGQLAAFVLAAAPNGSWGYRTIAKGGYVTPNSADLARQALEQCEWANLMPCYLIAVNGFSTRDAVGNYAQQPQMLDPDAKRFDYTTVPFVPEVDRRNLRQYFYTAGPKALMVSTGGYWTYEAGTTIIEAITKATGECKTGNSGVDCNLYAVNNFVVMDFAR